MVSVAGETAIFQINLLVPEERGEALFVIRKATDPSGSRSTNGTRDLRILKLLSISKSEHSNSRNVGSRRES